MAVSKIWPLYQTMDKAIRYICNYEKTEDGTLIDTYKCSEKFADYEFKDVAKKARQVKNARIGYHAMISFPPDENITPEKALEVGKKILSKYTKGKHQYVLTVHNDQTHIHVHCIFNSVNYEDHKKLQINDKDLNRLEKITDKVCRENNLSVIEEKSGVKGRKKYEYDKHRSGESWKDKVREAIDRNILLSSSYEEFIERMQMEEGYQIKQGKYLSFTLEHEGQKKAVRNRSLGDFYSIDSIKDRIENKGKYKKEAEISRGKNETANIENIVYPASENNKDVILFKEPISFDGKVKKLIDVGKNEKAQAHQAYRKKLNMINISTYAGMINFIKKYHLIYAEDYEKAKNGLEMKYSQLTDSIRNTYSELNSLEADVKQFQKYFKNKSAHERYMSTSDTDEKYFLGEAHKMYESALYYFKKNDIDISKMTPENISKQMEKIEKLKQKIEDLKAERKLVKADIKQLTIIAENNQAILGDSFNNSREYQKEAYTFDKEK